MRSRSLNLGLAMLALVALQACGEREPQSATVSTRTPSQTAPSSEPTDQRDPIDVSAEIIDTDFKPISVEVKAGSSVDWKQVGDQPHSVTAVDGSFDSSPDCGPLDSDMCLGQGDTFSHVFKEAGEFAYYCRVHGLPDGTGMFGTVVVVR